LTDLDSANGVYVDGKRISGHRLLAGGETIRVGSRELVVHVGSAMPGSGRSGPRSITHDAAREVTIADPVTEEFESGEPESTVTGAGFFEAAATVIEGLVRTKNDAEAERVVAPILDMVRDEARLRGTIKPDVVLRATSAALDLAEATKRGKWLDRLVAIYAALERPMPVETVDRIYGLIQQVDAVDARALQSYASMLGAIKVRLGPADRFVVGRIAGLVGVAKR
jgi:hypothetical protein